MRFGRWILPVAWMGVIFWLSTGRFSAEETGAWLLLLLRALLPGVTASQLAFTHLLGRKVAHVTEYAILAWLWHRPLRGSGPPGPPRLGREARALGAFALTFAYAILDELHQGWTGQRTPSALDVGVDGFGAAAALALLTWGWRPVAGRLTTALLWFAAAAGSLLLPVLLLVGVPGGWLWGSVPLAWIALWAWRRPRRSFPASLSPLAAPVPHRGEDRVEGERKG